jgi:hypothetical protein
VWAIEPRLARPRARESVACGEAQVAEPLRRELDTAAVLAAGEPAVISSAVTMYGPIGANVSRDLAFAPADLWR